MVRVEKRERKPDPRDHAMSDPFDGTEHEGGCSGDDDDYVHVHRGDPRGRRHLETEGHSSRTRME